MLSSMAATNPRWLAPEILAGRGYTFSSDVYSFGMLLWEMIACKVRRLSCVLFKDHSENSSCRVSSQQVAQTCNAETP